MNVDKTLEEIFGDFKLEVFPFENLGFIVNFIDEDHVIRGSGFRQEQETALNVAISEAVERYVFDVVSATKQHLTDQHPSTCGFAAGVNAEKAQLRSYFEGFERWCFSQWIDNQYQLDEVVPGQLTSLTEQLTTGFDKVVRYQKDFTALESGLLMPVSFGVTLLFKDEGVYAGSRVAVLGEDIWEHGAAEAWINHLNVHNNPRYKENDGLDLVERRVKYFATHAAEAVRQIKLANKKDWPLGKIEYHGEIIESPEPFFIYRTVYGGFVPWGVGPNDRFVY